MFLFFNPFKENHNLFYNELKSVDHSLLNKLTEYEKTTLNFDGYHYELHYYNSERYLHRTNGNPAVLQYYSNGNILCLEWHVNGFLDRKNKYHPTCICFHQNGMVANALYDISKICSWRYPYIIHYHENGDIDKNHTRWKLDDLVDLNYFEYEEILYSLELNPLDLKGLNSEHKNVIKSIFY